jgi:hypothetical protein
LRFSSLSHGSRVACQRTATLSGDVFVTMKSGDVKRGADVAVVLVPKTPEMDTQWSGLNGAFRAELAAAQQASRRAKAASDVARHQWHVAHQAVLDSIRNSFDDYDATNKRSNSAMERARAAANAADQASTRPFEIVLEFDKRAQALIAAKQVAAVRTDVNGRYRFSNVTPGAYYLHAAHQVFDNKARWWIPIQVKPGDQVTDLSNSNAGWPFSISP